MLRRSDVTSWQFLAQWLNARGSEYAAAGVLLYQKFPRSPQQCSEAPVLYSAMLRGACSAGDWSRVVHIWGLYITTEHLQKHPSIFQCSLLPMFFFCPHQNRPHIVQCKIKLPSSGSWSSHRGEAGTMSLHRLSSSKKYSLFSLNSAASSSPATSAGRLLKPCNYFTTFF